MSMTEGNSGAESPSDAQAAPAQNAAQATAQAPAAPAQNAAHASWRDSLPDDLKGSKSLTKFESVNDLALGYVNAESLIGRDKIPMPKTEEELLATFDRLGRPKTADDYGLAVDGAQYGEHVDKLLKKDLSWFKDTAHKAGLTKSQAAALYNGYMSNFGEIFRQRSADVEFEMQSAEATLKQEFGRDYQRNMAMANRALAYYGSEDLIKAVETSGIGRNPDFVKMLVKLGIERHEDIGIDKGGVQGKSLASAMEEAMADPAYTDATHPNHKRAVERVNLLFQQAHSD